MDHTSSRYARLSRADLSNLRLESASAPFHIGGLAIAEAAPLLDASGHLRLEEVADRLNRRLVRVPQLRRRVHRGGAFTGRPIWVDDDRFEISAHVHELAIPAPGDDRQLLDLAAQAFAGLLDRRGALWELSFLTGLNGGRIGVFLKVHHAIADGVAAVAILRSLLDSRVDDPEALAVPWTPQPPPHDGWLRRDALAAAGRGLSRSALRLSDPVPLLRSAGAITRGVGRALLQERAPRTSLNFPVRPGRRVRFLRLDLPTVRGVARSAGARINDVVLAVYSEGLRELLISRGEPVDGLVLRTSMPVSLRPGHRAEGLGNRVSLLVLPLPLREAGIRRRLELIADAGAKAGRERPVPIQAAFGSLAATPLAQHLIARQRIVNVFSTNVAGPPSHVYLLGARVLAILPIVQVAGNVGISLCAITYAGSLHLVVTADAAGFPDIDVLVGGMARGWHELIDPAAM